MFYVKHVTDKFPTGLLSAEAMANEIMISVDKLKEYAKTGFCPHYSIDDGEPLFQKSEVSNGQQPI